MKKPPLPLFTLRGHKAPVCAVEFLTNDKIVSGDAEGSLIMWDAESRRVEASRRDAHDRGVLSLAVKDGVMMMSQGREGDIKIWMYSLKDIKLLHVISTGSCTFCKMHLDGSRLATPSSDPNEFQLHTLNFGKDNKITSSKITHRPKCSFESGMCLALRLMERSVVVGFESGHVARFEISDDSSKKLLKPSLEAKLLRKPILCLEIDSKGYGICLGASSEIVFFVMTKDSCSIRTSIRVPSKPGFSDVALRNDNKIIALGGWDKTVRIFQWRRRRLPKPLAVLKDIFEETVSGVSFSPDSNLLAASSRDKNISVWSIYPVSSLSPS